MKTPTLSLPTSVIIAGILIALAIVFTAKPSAQPTPNNNTASLNALNPITETDHIYGNPNAPVTIVEYSDLDCPFCERFHNTLQQIVSEYPNDVRWVYRHFPLDFHPHAYDEAVIAECVGKLGGPEAFWNILPYLLTIPSSQSKQFNTDPIFAETSKLGINTTQLQECYETNEFKSIIDTDLANGAATGGDGTPWSVIIKPDGTYSSINGAQPYTVVKAIIDEIIQQQ